MELFNKYEPDILPMKWYMKNKGVEEDKNSLREKYIELFNNVLNFDVRISSILWDCNCF